LSSKLAKTGNKKYSIETGVLSKSMIIGNSNTRSSPRVILRESESVLKMMGGEILGGKIISGSVLGFEVTYIKNSANAWLPSALSIVTTI
jgi:hypothetical protein